LKVSLKKHCLSERKTSEKDIELSFFSGGAAYAMLNTKYDKETIKTTLTSLLGEIVIAVGFFNIKLSS
jgi:hypothetical protein